MSLAQCFSQSKHSERFYKYIDMNTHMHLFISGKTSVSHFCFFVNSLKAYQSLLEKGERGRELQVIPHQRFGEGGGYLLTGSVGQ